MDILIASFQSDHTNLISYPALNDEDMYWKSKVLKRIRNIFSIGNKAWWVFVL